MEDRLIALLRIESSMEDFLNLQVDNLEACIATRASDSHASAYHSKLANSSRVKRSLVSESGDLVLAGRTSSRIGYFGSLFRADFFKMYQMRYAMHSKSGILIDKCCQFSFATLHCYSACCFRIADLLCSYDCSVPLSFTWFACEVKSFWSFFNRLELASLRSVQLWK